MRITLFGMISLLTKVAPDDTRRQQSECLVAKKKKKISIKTKQMAKTKIARSSDEDEGDKGTSEAVKDVI